MFQMDFHFELTQNPDGEWRWRCLWARNTPTVTAYGFVTRDNMPRRGRWWHIPVACASGVLMCLVGVQQQCLIGSDICWVLVREKRDEESCQCLEGSCSVPGDTCTLPDLIYTTVLWGCLWYPHFAEEWTEALRDELSLFLTAHTWDWE